MYSKEIFEIAMTSCGYIADKVVYIDGSQDVRKIEGRVGIPSEFLLLNDRSTITRDCYFLRDAVGRCFSLQSNVRQRRYDLPLMTIVEFNKQKESERQML